MLVVSGLDFAHCRDGYVYHTAKDDLVSIVDLPGVIQHTGDNVLSMVLTFTGNKSKLSTLHFVPNQNSVYFDILGIIFFSYSTSTAVLINSVAIFLSAICFLLVWFPTRKSEYSFAQNTLLSQMEDIRVPSVLILGEITYKF